MMGIAQTVGGLVALTLSMSSAGCRRANESERVPPAAASSRASATPAPRGTAAPAAKGSAEATAPASDACQRLPLLSVYRRAGAIVERSSKRVRLTLRIDLHMADCGAPDAYGHDMDVSIELASRDGRCDVTSASARSTPFGDGMPDAPTKPWKDAYLPRKPVDLADPNLEALELVDEGAKRALVLRAHEYYYYESIRPGAPLKPELESEDSKGCCFGSTGSAARSWHYEFFRSPFGDSPVESLEKEELDAFNRWATDNELRDDPIRLAKRGFELSPKAKIDVRFAPGDPPLGATVTARDRLVGTEEPKKDVGERVLVLELSRKPCADCPGRATPWWTWSVKEKR